jgi:hypothetical protein
MIEVSGKVAETREKAQWNRHRDQERSAKWPFQTQHFFQGINGWVFVTDQFDVVIQARTRQQPT